MGNTHRCQKSHSVAEHTSHGLAFLDKNKDGKLTKDELMAAGLMDAQETGLIKSMDRNGDNSISLRGKASEARAFVKAADSNHDRAVTPEELTALLATPKVDPSQTASGAAAC